eukprot:TRINITY_DN1230_c0_g1_i3.p1 TRINITY_DN1230_c0_g1~~TRINITY_DN1230_c0_g1_i3.p1  ORF type:complete len:779 (-),score=169.93 TRINITY_DN1230_c0_g1_i3:56-2359(-)
MKFKARGKWKSIPMPHTMFTQSFDSAMCGGIEVLDDYSINGKDEVVKKSAPKRKNTEDLVESSPSKKKKNLFEVSELKADDLQIEKSSEEKSETTKKKKKAKKKQVKNKPALNLQALQNFASTVNEPKARKDTSTNKQIVQSPEDSFADKEKKDKESDNESVPDTDDKDVPDPKNVTDMIEWKSALVCDEIVEALAEKGFQSPTPIQKLTLPSALKGRLDIVGAAETGSGKTLAFGIPIIQGILEDRKRELDGQSNAEGEGKSDVDDDIGGQAEEEDLAVGKQGGKLRALIMTPTRELAIQIKDHIQDIVKKVGVSVAVVIGGICPEKQLRLLKREPEIVVGTPGRLWELIQEGVPHLQNLPSIRYLAIDETDRMSEKGHFAELEKILEVVQGGEGKKQKFVMSATLSLVHRAPYYKKGKPLKQKSPKEKLKELMDFVGVGERRKVVDITSSEGTASALTESVIHCSISQKDAYLYYFIKTHPGRCLVFCNSIDCVRRLAKLFSFLDAKPLPIHAQMHQKQRLKNLERFCKSDDGLLIATDVAARGLDIPNIQHVLHYQVPRTSESYIHRSGRTARANNEGLSVLLIDPSELHLYKKLRITLKRDADMPLFPVDQPRFRTLTERVECAQRLDKLSLQIRRKKVDDNWLSETAKEADLILSDNEDEDTNNLKNEEQAALRHQVEATRKELETLLRRPVVSHEFQSKYPTQNGALPIFLTTSGTHQSAIQALNSDLQAKTEFKRKMNKQNSMKRNKKFKKKGNKKKAST